jgi:dolichyl-phosphate-mannose--protein O-mannosyl transferase
MIASLILTVASLVLGALRIHGEKGEIFQAIAHLFVGGLFVACWFSFKWWHLVLAVGLCLLEVLVTLRDRGII